MIDRKIKKQVNEDWMKNILKKRKEIEKNIKNKQTEETSNKIVKKIKSRKNGKKF